MNENGKHRTNILQSLASSPDRFVQLGTLGLVAISGILNFFETREASHDNRKLFERQTAEIWAALDRNKDNFKALFDNASSNRKLLTERVDNQTKLLQNQEQILRNQQTALEVIQESQRQFLLRQQRMMPQRPDIP